MSALRPPAEVFGRLGTPQRDGNERRDDDDLAMIQQERRAPSQFARLQHTLERQAPACEDDARFTTDAHELPAGTSAALRAVCESCPVWEPCEAYARAASPAGGFWAGISYPVRRTKSDDE